MRGRGEAELGRQPLGDLRPALACVVAPVHPDVVLLVHAVAVDRRADELVDAEADLLVRPWPVRAESAVARRPGRGVVRRLEQSHSLDDRPEARRLLRVEHERGDAEVAGRLVRRVVPQVAAGFSRERRQQRPVLASVATLEDPGCLHADEHAPVLHGERRDLRQLPIAVRLVGEALARLRPRLAEVRAAPDGRAVPLARSGGEDRPRRGVVNGVVHGPRLAERAAQRPVAPSLVALQQEAPLAGSDQYQRP